MHVLLKIRFKGLKPYQIIFKKFEIGFNIQ